MHIGLIGKSPWLIYMYLLVRVDIRFGPPLDSNLIMTHTALVNNLVP